MTDSKLDFLPIILGTDLNAYTMASSFYETYKRKSIFVGKIPMRFTEGSSFVETIHYHDDLLEPTTFKEVLKTIADEYSKVADNLILIGTNDIYVNLIIDHADFLKDYYVFNNLSNDLRNQIFYKKNFYELCEKHGIDYPKTEFYDCSNPTPVETDFDYPIVMKPSNVVEYQTKGLHAENKLYFLDTKEELDAALNGIIEAGYTDDMIIQEYIPGGDTQMWDAVYYADQHGNAQLITLAQVILQERQSHLVGAYTALFLRHNREFMEKLVHFLEDIGYTGFGNFDIKQDPRDGKFKVFEINIRQGRSSSYIDTMGYPLAKMIVDDVVYNKEKEIAYMDGELLYSVVPNFTLKKELKGTPLWADVQPVIKKGKVVNPLTSKEDKGLKRRMQMLLRKYNYSRKY